MSCLCAYFWEKILAFFDTLIDHRVTSTEAVLVKEIEGNLVS